MLKNRVARNIVARNIVANLAWRYRFARNTELRQQGQSLIWDAHLSGQTAEAWNAYVSSSRVLLGILD